ncbi:MAG: mtrB, partial [Nocardioidaceae bacterium]|nr:mtrB [Nocardioidaceae bacterium]
AIAREDALLHGGTLLAWGRKGEGSSFRLTLPRRAGEPLGRSPLPLVPEDAVAEPAPTPPPVKQPGRRPTAGTRP